MYVFMYVMYVFYVCMYVCMYACTRGGPKDLALAPQPSVIYFASLFDEPFINPTPRLKCRTLFMGAS
jgi:hypothetical protein